MEMGEQFWGREALASPWSSGPPSAASQSHDLGCLAHRLSGDFRLARLSQKGGKAALFRAFMGRSAKTAACQFVVCLIRSL